MTAANTSLLLLWGSFLVGFVFIRVSTRLIRAQVRWWPGNFTPGGHHIHHVVFGMVLVLIAGFGSFSPLGRTGGWEETFAVGFGIGAALVLDEFALILHLRDVYWSEEGRSSIDAVVLGVALSGLLVSGVLPFGLTAGNGSHVRLSTVIWLVLNIGFVVVSLLKGKTWTGLIGIFLPGLALIGALRVARPGSPWGRRYPPDSRRLGRARHREVKRARRVDLRHRVVELVSGAPSAEPPAAQDLSSRPADETAMRE